MIYLILPLNRNKFSNNSASKLWSKYFYINMNTTIIIAKLKTIHWIMPYNGIKNSLYVFEIDTTQQ